MTLEDLGLQGTDSCQYLLFWTRDGRSLARGRNVADSSRVMVISAGSARRDVRATAASIQVGWQKCHSLKRVPGGEAKSTRYDVIVVGAGTTGCTCATYTYSITGCGLLKFNPGGPEHPDRQCKWQPNDVGIVPPDPLDEPRGAALNRVPSALPTPSPRRAYASISSSANARMRTRVTVRRTARSSPLATATPEWTSWARPRRSRSIRRT